MEVINDLSDRPTARTLFDQRTLQAMQREDIKCYSEAYAEFINNQFFFFVTFI